MMHAFLVALAGVGSLVALITFVGRLGAAGRVVSGALCRAPGLDLVVAGLTWAPWPLAWWFEGWRGVLGAMGAQVVTLGVWVTLHELAHLERVRGPRIVRFLNRTVGRWRNHAALWVTVIALPVFWVVRAAEVFVYPLLPLLIGLPRYRHSEWVNVSRQKFEGLVGHDLIWCLYCDWMTGVYALGGEMLRNVESFWCPIRFYDGKKCENCRVDFPDIDGGWVRADGDMGAVEAKMQEMYGGGLRSWFGHPERRAKGEGASVDVTVSAPRNGAHGPTGGSA